jgi:hypothetical protein
MYVVTYLVYILYLYPRLSGNFFMGQYFRNCVFFWKPPKKPAKASEIPTAVCKSVRHGEKSVGARVLAPYEVACWLFHSLVQINSVSFYFGSCHASLLLRVFLVCWAVGSLLKKDDITR